MRTLMCVVSLLVVLLVMPASAQRVSPRAPAPNRTIAAPVAHRPPGGYHPESTAGTIEGFVYWDANSFSHAPAGNCSGLAVTVSVGSSSGGPLVAYTPLATLTNNFKYLGQVREFLVGGKVKMYDVCTYGYNHVPVGPDLQVKLTVTQPTVFSPAAVPQFEILGPIKIINAQCNMLPAITNPSVSDLLAHWGSCQNMAYDVNFVMHTAPHPQFGASGGGSMTPAGSVTQRGMLSNSPQQGMLAGAGSTSSRRRQTEDCWGVRINTAHACQRNASKQSGTQSTAAPTANDYWRRNRNSGHHRPQIQRGTIVSSGCTVAQLQLRFRTGNDDLRGGQNNLNVEVHFADGSMQVANNVNHGANWGKNDTNVVTVPVQHPVGPTRSRCFGWSTRRTAAHSSRVLRVGR